jgi:hypothetical protein
MKIPRPPSLSSTRPRRKDLLYARTLDAKYLFTILMDNASRAAGLPGFLQATLTLIQPSAPDIHVPGLDTHGIPPDQMEKGSFCMHPKWGIRPAQFCRMPVLWAILWQDPSIERLVHIGTSDVASVSGKPIPNHSAASTQTRTPSSGPRTTRCNATLTDYLNPPADRLHEQRTSAASHPMHRVLCEDTRPEPGPNRPRLWSLQLECQGTRPSDDRHRLFEIVMGLGVRG